MQLLAGVDDLPRTGNVRTQLMALWVTAVSLAILLVAYAVFPGFWPPMSPQMSAHAVAEFYRDNTGLIRFSMVTFNLFGIMLLPLFCVIVGADQAHGGAEPGVRLLLSDGDRQWRDASSHCPTSSSPPPHIDPPATRSDRGSQRSRLDRVRGARRHGARPEPDVGIGDLLRQRRPSRLPAVGGPLRHGRRLGDGPGGVLGDGHHRAPRLGWRRSRSGCATSPSGHSSW